MKKYIIFPLLLTVFLFSCRNDRQLTEKQKADDFLYLYETLEANYPYFDRLKRMQGIDWLANKDKYLEKVRSASNDTTYVLAIGEILDELHDGHTDIFPTIDPDMFIDTYSSILEDNPEYDVWVRTMKKNYKRTKYWSDILMSLYGEGDDEEEPYQQAEVVSHYKDSLITGSNIAIMTVPSFMNQLIEKDGPRIERFLGGLSGSETLVIDIQGNGGGNTEYWKNLIVSRLISDTVEYRHYFAVKKGDINRKYYREYFEAGDGVGREDAFYEKIPSYFSDGRYLIVMTKETVVPDNPINFSGPVYVLVDGSVFSSAEGLAYFSQITGWATVAGRTTGGDGVGKDPVIISLPESGIKIRFPASAGFNADGSLNSEKGTTPDIPLEGRTRALRLENLIDMLTTAQ